MQALGLRLEPWLSAPLTHYNWLLPSPSLKTKGSQQRDHIKTRTKNLSFKRRVHSHRTKIPQKGFFFFFFLKEFILNVDHARHSFDLMCDCSASALVSSSTWGTFPFWNASRSQLSESKGAASVHFSSLKINYKTTGRNITNVSWWEGGGASRGFQFISESSKRLCKCQSFQMHRSIHTVLWREKKKTFPLVYFQVIAGRSASIHLTHTFIRCIIQI